MPSKGIAIQTVLLLLVGILVVGVLVYALYSSTSNSPMSEYECRGKMISWCTGCSNAGWTGGTAMSDKLKECAQKYWSIAGHADCNAKQDCSAFIPIFGGGGGGGGTTTPTTTTIPSALDCIGDGGTCNLNPAQCNGIGGFCNPAYTDCPPGRCCCFF